MTPIERFRQLHSEGVFVMPNPYDAGSARVLAALGFPALATTSSGFAGTLGRLDMTVDRDEMLAHVAVMAAATELPLNADSERCFGEDPAGVEDTVDRIGQAGAAGCSIEDWNPDTAAIDPLDVAAQRVAAAAAGAARHGLVLTARCENHLHGYDDLDDTIRRLLAYRDAGAEVVYAPGLVDLGQIRRIVDEVGVPVNVLLRPGGPTVGQLGDVGVRRISVGGTLARIALGALADAARHLLDDGQYAPDQPLLDNRLAATAFGPPAEQ
jgi:2-methylisocitrate lyase-like PEP mutase family enzyme